MVSHNITTEKVVLEPISVDLKQIIEHGESPTAVILAITIFTGVLLGSVVKLIDGISLMLQRFDCSKKREE